MESGPGNVSIFITLSQTAKTAARQVWDVIFLESRSAAHDVILFEESDVIKIVPLPVFTPFPSLGEHFHGEKTKRLFFSRPKTAPFYDPQIASCMNFSCVEGKSMSTFGI